MIKKDILARLKKAVIEGNTDNCKRCVGEIIKSGIDISEAIKNCADGMGIIGEKWKRKELFIPEVLLSVDAMHVTIDGLIPYTRVKKSSVSGKIVIGVVEGDIHDIGKNIVRALFEVEGFKVFDLGKNVPLRMFIDKIKKTDADILALSTLMTATFPGIKLLIDKLKEEKMRNKIKVIIGGASTSKELVEKVGADAWAEDAFEGVRIAKRLLNKEGKT